jgi:hypothetical protein
VCFILVGFTFYSKLTDLKDATQCALNILSMTEGTLDKDARLKILEALSDMPEGIDIVKWLYKLLIKSMLSLNTGIPTQTNIHIKNAAARDKYYHLRYKITVSGMIPPLAVKSHH